MLGGGRYDGLIETLGGPHTPAVGWAAGIERLGMLVGAAVKCAFDVAVVVENEIALTTALRAAKDLRNAGISVEMWASGSPRKRFDRATKSGASSIVAIDREGTEVKMRVRAVDGSELATKLSEILGHWE